MYKIGSKSNQADEQNEKETDKAYSDASLPGELLWVHPTADAQLWTLELGAEGDDVVDAGEAALKLSLVSLGLDRANQEFGV